MNPVTPLPPDIIAALRSRIAVHGGNPLLTWYGPADERVELSATTVGNWADKIANYLDNEGCDAGDVLAAPLLAERPCHWTSLVWLLGALQWGMQVSLDAVGDIAVVGPGGTAQTDLVVECSLHPLGLGGDVTPGHSSFDDIRLQPDIHQRQPWDQTLLEHAGVIVPRSTRNIVTPGDGWPTLNEAILAPLAGGGSTVLIEGDLDDNRRARIAAAERAEF